MIKNTSRLFLILLISTLYCGCQKPKSYSEIPSISFKSVGTYRTVDGLDSLSVITITFTDGDGDLGYHDCGSCGCYCNGATYDDPNSVYYYDFVVSAFNLKNGEWIEDTIYSRKPYPGYSGRLPYLTPDGDNKALKGEISMRQFLLPGLTNDTMRYSVYIYDRALHKSNIITTAAFIVTD